MTFWIVVLLMALAVAALLAVALLRGRAATGPAAAYDLRVYRDQLRDVDRDLARGVIEPADAERVRAEVSRRILAADAETRQGPAGAGAPRAVSVAVATGLALVLLAGSFGLYLAIGSPEQTDLPLRARIAMAEELRQVRPRQGEAQAAVPPRPAPDLDAGYAALLEQLRAKVAERPDDVQGHLLLARHEASIGNFAAAERAQARVIALMGDAAGAEEFADHAEMLILAAGGYVSPEAEAALRATLQRDPGNGAARYYWGLMMAQIGRPDMAFEVWEQTLRRGPPDAPWIRPIRAQIAEMAWRAGVDYELPEAPPEGPGPTPQDMQAAAELSGAERDEMVRGMVERLSDRLDAEGGSATDWARLIGALAVLGETDRARAALARADTAFAGDAGALDILAAAARQAGLAP